MDDQHSFEDLQVLINTVSRAQSSKEVIDLSLKHLTESTLFGFDYAIFSEVNYLDEQLKILHSVCRSPLIIDPIKWRYDSNVFSLKGRDVMAVAVKEDSIIKVKSDIRDGKFDYTLDKQTFDKFKHSELLRYFVPLMDRRKSNIINKIGDPTVGLLELGCHRSNEDKFEAIAEIQLGLYADNLAQSYQKNYYSEQREYLRLKIASYEEQSGDHFDFLQLIIDDCRRTCGAEFAKVGFVSMDDFSLWQSKQKLISGDVNFSIDLADINQNYIHEIISENFPKLFGRNLILSSSKKLAENLQSFLVLPLCHSNTCLGAIFLTSSKPDCFNEFKIKYGQDITRESMNIFLDLKIANAVQTLVKPFSFYNKSQIYEQSCLRLSRYFAAKYIVFWENDINSKDIFKHKFISKHLAADNSDIYKVLVAPGEPFSGEDASIILLHEQSDFNSLINFANNAGFKSIIYIPLKSHRGVESFITLFSFKEVNRIFPEDRTLFNHLGAKARLSLAYSDIFSFFEELSLLNYEEEIDIILDNLMDSIQKIIGADLLLLFRFDQENQKFIHASTKGNLKNEKLEQRLESKQVDNEDFSFLVMQRGSLWIDTQDQYDAEFQKEKRGWLGGGEFQQDFWERERIQSLAAIRIEFANEHLGVMFFNFRTQQVFDNDTKNLIELLSNSVARVIAFSQTQVLKDKFENERVEEIHSFAETELAKSVLHNINNLLQDVSYTFQALRTSIEKADIARDAKDSIYKQVEALGVDIGAVANDYLLFRKYMQSEDQVIEQYQLMDIINEAINVVRFKIKERKITIRLDVNKNEQVLADKLQIVHVVLNLVKNAIEANAKQIWITCEEKIERFRSGDVNFKVIAIKDNGAGIKDEIRSKIFQPKFTTKKYGTGMGLPMSQHILEKHSGRLDVRSQVGGGTTFSIYLPFNS